METIWNGTSWFVEFDIKGYFDNINHEKLINILEERIDDRRFIKLIKNMKIAGYMEDWKYNRTYSSTPQGGVISPILANIYLDKLDQFIHGEIKSSRGVRKGVRTLTTTFFIRRSTLSLSASIGGRHI